MKSSVYLDGWRILSEAEKVDLHLTPTGWVWRIEGLVGSARGGALGMEIGPVSEEKAAAHRLLAAERIAAIQGATVEIAVLCSPAAGGGYLLGARGYTAEAAIVEDRLQATFLLAGFPKVM